MSHRSGRHSLQIPGPTNVPDRVLRAMAAPTIDHRGPEFRALARQLLADVRRPCGTTGPVAMYPSSGTGAWEAALVNTLSPGDKILAFETGHFATLWCEMARRLGLSLAGTLCGVEMGLTLAGVPVTRDGVRAALDYLTATA